MSQVLSKNCGGYGAWIDNPLSSPAPGAGLWPGFQIGGGGVRRGFRGRSRRSRRSRCSRRRHKSRKNNKRHQKKTMRK